MKVLIFGAGNLILSDEGFGVHFVKYMEEQFNLPENVELYDGGTLGIMVTHKFEEADKVFLVDIVDAPGAAGEIRRYTKEDIMLSRLPVKLSPHQIGIQEMLTISELRGAAPADLTFYGIIPASLEPGNELSPPLHSGLQAIAGLICGELREAGVTVTARN
ncbi:MAG: hydrogenase maturation protease [Geobacter sp.]|nr:hydrogenase maturation protease [Geobacter sp.]